VSGVLVLTALESELKASRAPDGVKVIYTGVGKINTAMATTAALLAGKPRLVVNYGTAVCGTGDSFVTATDPWLIENKVDLVDMELFAIAHVCKCYDVPWRAFKFITDDANDFAHEHWTANVANGEDLFWDALTRDVLGRQ
jgi:adenosylhomocysteine nucleosidase